MYISKNICNFAELKKQEIIYMMNAHLNNLKGLRLVVMTMLAMLMLPMVMMAEPVGKDEAKQKALAFLNGRAASRAGARAASAQELRLEYTSDEYHIFNRGEKDGFVIVGGDDCAPEILGYADNGTFDWEHMPDNLRAWMQGYKENIKMLRASGVKYSANESAAKTRAGGSKSHIDPLLTSKWDQYEPYYLQTPTLDGVHCVTGCVATAMAQVMYYWYKKNGYETTLQKDIPAYYSPKIGKTLDGLPAPATFDWANMTDTYGNGSTDAEKQAVAKLMKYCGYSVEMQYVKGSLDGSGAWREDIPEALRYYFGYKTASYQNRSWHSTDQWIDILYNELAAARPVLYGGYSYGGHRFVCDGYDYDKDDYFHFNWGWSGGGDGYYTLDKMYRSLNDKHYITIFHPTEEPVQTITPDLEQGDIECTKIEMPEFFKNKEAKIKVTIKNTDKSNSVHTVMRIDVNADNVIRTERFVDCEPGESQEKEISITVSNVGKHLLTVSKLKHNTDNVWIKLKEVEINVGGIELKGEPSISREGTALSCDVSLKGQIYRAFGNIFQIDKEIDIDPSSVHVSWEWVFNEHWYELTSEATYTIKKEDIGKIVRARIKADNFDEVIYSQEYEIEKVANPETPVPANLDIHNDQVRVKYAVPSQEYIIRDFQQPIVTLSESDWANAKSPTSSGQLYLGGYEGKVNYVYTRKKATDLMFAGNNVDRNSIYLGAQTTGIQGLSLKVELQGGSAYNRYYSTIDDKENDAYYIHVDDVLRITASPLPATATPFWGIHTSRWINNKKGGTFYEDAECQTPLQENQNYNQVYYKATKPMSYNEILVEYSRGYNDVLHESFNLHVADEEGNWLADNINPPSYEIYMGWKYWDIPLNVHPMGATVSNATLVLDQSASSEGEAPIVTFFDDDHTMEVNAWDATEGTYVFDIWQGDRKMESRAFVKVKRPAVESVKILGDDIVADRGATILLETQLKPYGAKAGVVMWNVDDESIATIDQEGLLTIKDDAPRGVTTKVRVLVDAIYMDEIDLTVPMLEPQLWFDETNFEVYQNATFTPPTLNNPQGLTMKYSCSHPEVASIDKTTGAVTLNGPGTAIITAYTNGNDDYNYGDAYYLLTVKEPLPGDSDGNGKVEPDDITAIEDYILTGKTDGINLGNADLNGDGKVDVADLVLLINKMK